MDMRGAMHGDRDTRKDLDPMSIEMSSEPRKAVAGIHHTPYRSWILAAISSAATSILMYILMVRPSYFIDSYRADMHQTLSAVKFPVCASELVHNRKVALADFAPWDMYQRGEGYLGGESYWGASLHYILKSLNFSVEFVDYEKFLKHRSGELVDGRVHRLVVNDPAKLWRNKHKALENPSAQCRIRTLNYWSNWDCHDDACKGIDLRQILSPFPDRLNTPIPSFVHSLVTLPPNQDAGNRKRRCYILGKSGKYFGTDRVKALLTALADANFELHTTCSGAGCWMPPRGEIVKHGKMLPPEFSKFLRKMAFIVGFGDPKVSPTPLEGLAAGAAFLNPILSSEKAAIHGYVGGREGVRATDTQHAALSMLGAPYVYNYDINDTSALLQAAERAVKNRFASFVPSAFRVEGVASLVCAGLLESGALCSCPEAQRQGDSSLDCRGSMYSTVSAHGDHTSLAQDTGQYYSPVV